MNIQIGPEAQLLYIDDIALQVFTVVSEVYRLYGKTALLTFAADNEYEKDSCYVPGHTWHFYALHDRAHNNIKRRIRYILKDIDSCYEVVEMGIKGQERIRIEYNDRKADYLRHNPTGLDIDIKHETTEEKMAKETTYKWILSVAAILLGRLIREVTEKFRIELTDWVTRKYQEALATDNPFDDLFFEFLAKMLEIDV